MRGILLLLALLLPAAGAPDDLLRAARESRSQGRFPDAIAEFRRALERRPDDPAILGELAQVLSWDGQFDPAIETYRRALEIDPGADALRLGLARTYSWAKRYGESLTIYEAYRADHPGDEALWLEETKVRSWSGDYEGAVDAYRGYLSERPGAAEVRLELAKVLSWGGRYAESVEEYRRILAVDPAQRDARLGLARVLSWSGRYAESIAEYDVLLTADPGDVEAQVGKARSLAWSGDLAGAEAGYDAILSGRPEESQALLGKAQIAYWLGDERESERLLSLAEAASPDDPDVASFRGEVRKQRRPFLDSAYHNVEDTDGNDYKRLSVFVTVRPVSGLQVTPYAARTEAFQRGVTPNSCSVQAGDGTASVDSLGVRFGWTLPRGVGMLASAGVDRTHPSGGAELNGESSNRAVGSVLAFGSFAGSWRWRANVERRTFDATRVILDCDLAYDALTGGVSGTWKKWRFGGGTGFTDFSDGNGRVHLDLSATRPLELGPHHTLELGYRFRYMAYDENLANGYFDPQSFFSNLLVVNARGRLVIERLDYAVLVSFGIQSFELDDATLPILVRDLNTGVVTEQPVDFRPDPATSDAVLGWEVRIGWNVTRRARLEGYYGQTDYAAQSATGFESESSGLLFRYRF